MAKLVKFYKKICLDLDTHRGYIHSMDKSTKKCCCKKQTVRSEEEKKKLVNRLCKIEGQIRGLEKMVLEDAYCTDILVQVSAARSALESFATGILENHINGCVARDLKKGDTEVVEELIWILKKLK